MQLSLHSWKHCKWVCACAERSKEGPSTFTFLAISTKSWGWSSPNCCHAAGKDAAAIGTWPSNAAWSPFMKALQVSLGARANFAQHTLGKQQQPSASLSLTVFSILPPPSKGSFLGLILGWGMFALGCPELGISQLLGSYWLSRRDGYAGKSQDCACLFLWTIGITSFAVLSQQKAN